MHAKPAYRLSRQVILYDGPNEDKYLFYDASNQPQSFVLPADEMQILKQFVVLKKIHEVADNLDISDDRVQKVLDKWEHKTGGLLRQQSLEQELAQEREEKKQQAQFAQWMTLNDNYSEDTRHYHSEVIDDALHNFEEVETTLSHFFHVAHPALHGLTYGGAFCDAVMRRKSLQPGAKFLEIGCGTGLFAKCFLDRLQTKYPEVYQNFHYTMLDLSPALRASQQQMCQAHIEHIHFVQHDIADYVPKERFDVVISNEVIADLPVHFMDLHYPDQSDFEALELFEKYELSVPNHESRFLLNSGAMKMIALLSSLLAEDALAFVSEYGGVDAFPERRKLGDHVEYSIHFGHLQQVAQIHGLVHSVELATDFLEFDKNVEIIDLFNLDLIRKDLRIKLGQDPLRRIALTPKMLRDQLGAVAEQVHNVYYYPVGQYPYDLIPDRFLFLCLQAPAGLEK